MENNLLKKIILVFTLSMPFIETAHALSSFSETKIARLIMHDSGDVLVIFRTKVVNGEGCTNTGQVVLKRNSPFFKERYAALLSAFHGQTVITGYVNGCSEEWQSKGTPYLIRFDMLK